VETAGSKLECKRDYPTLVKYTYLADGGPKAESVSPRTGESFVAKGAQTPAPFGGLEEYRFYDSCSIPSSKIGEGSFG